MVQGADLSARASATLERGLKAMLHALYPHTGIVRSRLTHRCGGGRTSADARVVEPKAPWSVNRDVPRHRWLSSLVSLLLVLMFASPVLASATLRVRGGAQFDAVRVRHSVQGYEVTGVLHDDMNQPIPGAALTLRGPTDVTGCDNAPPQTDDSGKFCLVTSQFAPGNELLFSGNIFFDPARYPLQPSVDTPAPKLTIRTAPEWALSMSRHQVVATVADVALSARPHVGLELLRDGSVSTLVAPEPLVPNSPLTLSVDSAILPPAGKAMLRATLFTGTRAVLATQEAPLILVSIVNLSIESVPSTLRSNDTFTATFVAQGNRAPLTSGWVELLADGRSIGLGPVLEGKASVTGALHSARERVVQFSARYVPEYPWFKPSRPVAFPVTLFGPLPWAHVPWALLALGATLWVVRTWRRPARLPDTRRPEAAVNAGVVITSSRPGASGWEGIVIDAHTESPVARAQLFLRIPSLAADGILVETQTDDSGRFMLTAPTALPEGTRLIVEAEHYSALKQPLPPPCHMRVGLVLRRRTLLSLFQEWAAHLSLGTVEITPQAVAREARRAERPDVESWATDVENAVFGPNPPTPGEEVDLTTRLPTTDRSQSRSR